jgi:hydroxyacylglutathione hydrolase
MAFEIRTRTVGNWQMNSYVLVCPQTAASVLIDPGDAPDTLRDMLVDTTPVAILLTHTHPDHVGALDIMKEELQVPLLAHPGPRRRGVEVTPDQALRGGEQISVGEHTLEAIYAPGHSDDMLCYAEVGGPAVVVGDTIFAGGPGRTWFPEDFQTTLRTLREVVLRWPNGVVCYPGHGPSFPLADKRDAIEEFLARDHGDFYGDAEW